jgi:hypothetical protein
MDLGFERVRKKATIARIARGLTIAGAFAIIAGIAAPAPAHADDWRRDWRQKEWRHHHHRHWRGPPAYVYGPPRVVYAPPPVYYAPPPVYYAPPPRVVYAPAPAASLNFVFPIR